MTILKKIIITNMLLLASLRVFAGQGMDYQQLDMLMRADIPKAQAVVSYGAHMSSRCGASYSVTELTKADTVIKLESAYRRNDADRVNTILAKQQCYVFSSLTKKLDELRAVLASQQACSEVESRLAELNLPDEMIKEKVASMVSLNQLCADKKSVPPEVLSDLRSELETAECGGYEDAATMLDSENPMRKLKGSVCRKALTLFNELKKEQKREG